MGLGTRITVFLIVVHTFSFYAAGSGYIPQKTGDNPHEAFIGNVTGEQLDDSVQTGTGNQSTVSTGDFGIAVKSLDFISFIGGILTAPYDLVSNTGWPAFAKTLVQALLGFLKAAAVASFVRGVDF